MAANGFFSDIKEGVSSALVDTTRTAGQISNEDLGFYRSSNSPIISLLEQQNERLLQLARSLTKIATSGTEVTAPKISDADSIEDNWKGIVDVFDNLLEKADACLDEYTGVIKRLSPAQEEQIKKAAQPIGKQRPAKAYQTQNIAKPQLLFPKAPRNDETSPFKPLLRSKPHAIVPLKESLQLTAADDGSKQYGSQSYSILRDSPLNLKELINTELRYKHPYETEIKISVYPPAAYKRSDPTPFLPYEKTKATLVDTLEAVIAMLQELKRAKEIAVDLEHHDEHSYIGLVSLMQISTRDKDWIVDTLKPWREDLKILNEVFADPRILKIFHGAYMDMIWLQRDFGLYVVGLFDTYHASRALGYPKHSLAYLLKHFADFDAAKQYQMADWRIRPLPGEMFNYARSDTHFLLYVYDNMRNELIDKFDASRPDGDLIKVVMDNSKEEALQRYERPFYDMQNGSGSMGWYKMLCRTPALFNRSQFAVFRAVHQWRDTIARQEDESVHQVIPKHVLYNIARELPTDMPSLLGCSHPMSKSFQKRKGELLGVIRQAKASGATGPEMSDFMQTISPLYSDRMMKASGGGKVSTTSTVADKDALPPPQITESGLPGKTDSSRFWGPNVKRNATTRRLPLIRMRHESLRLALPLPQLTAEVFEDLKTTEQGPTETAQTNLGARAEHQYVKDRKRKEDDVFVIKQASGSRKRKVTELDGHPELISPYSNGESVAEGVLTKDDGMEISSSIAKAEGSMTITGMPRLTREQKQERRQEEKRLEKEKSLQEGGVPDSKRLGEVQAFDYANAPSVLQAKQTDNDRAVASKSVNPYVKSLDAPKVMRKSYPKKEIGGKSFTFKS